MSKMPNKSSATEVFNFGAGPACLPPSVLEQIREDIPHWHDGMSIMEISHRLPAVVTYMENIEANLRQLLHIPEEFAVLFMHGGARTQFSAVPLNLLHRPKIEPCADYLITGHWSQLAHHDATRYGKTHVVANSVNYAEENCTPHAAYFHYTDNETIHGIEFHHTPIVQDTWLVSDMTSNILTKSIDFKTHGLVYASTQKNMGIAGLTVVIVRKELLGFAHPFTPYTLDYQICEKMGSMSNTPPVFNWYVAGLMIQWSLDQGGITALEAACLEKSALFYDYIDNSEGFYSNTVNTAYRSRITIPFQLSTPELETQFIAQANAQGLKQLQGHKIVGGCRACFYNAMPIEGVQALVDFMREFQKTHG